MFDVSHSIRMPTRMVYHPELRKSRCLRLIGASTAVIARAESFRRDAGAVTSIEYALMASFIAVTIAGICGALFSKLSTEYTEIGNIFS